MVGIVALAGAQAAHDSKVARLSQILRSASSQRVRMQAAIILGRLRKPAAVPALVRALADPQPNVRKVSAAALGQIGDKDAAGPLRRALGDKSDGVCAAAAIALAEVGDRTAIALLRKVLKRRKGSLVRTHVRKAIRRLQRGEGAAGAPRFYVTLGKISNKAGRGGKGMSEALGNALLRELSGEKGVVARKRAQMPAASDIRRRKIKAFVLDGSIVGLSHERRGGEVELSCSIRVSLATYPENSMKAFYNGGASMAVSARSFKPSTADQLYRELLRGAAQGAKQHILQSYLRHQ